MLRKKPSNRSRIGGISSFKDPMNLTNNNFYTKTIPEVDEEDYDQPKPVIEGKKLPSVVNKSHDIDGEESFRYSEESSVEPYRMLKKKGLVSKQIDMSELSPLNTGNSFYAKPRTTSGTVNEKIDERRKSQESVEVDSEVNDIQRSKYGNNYDDDLLALLGHKMNTSSDTPGEVLESFEEGMDFGLIKPDSIVDGQGNDTISFTSNDRFLDDKALRTTFFGKNSTTHKDKVKDSNKEIRHNERESTTRNNETKTKLLTSPEMSVLKANIEVVNNQMENKFSDLQNKKEDFNLLSQQSSSLRLFQTTKDSKNSNSSKQKAAQKNFEEFIPDMPSVYEEESQSKSLVSGYTDCFTYPVKGPDKSMLSVMPKYMMDEKTIISGNSLSQQISYTSIMQKEKSYLSGISGHPDNAEEGESRDKERRSKPGMDKEGSVVSRMVEHENVTIVSGNSLSKIMSYTSHIHKDKSYLSGHSTDSYGLENQKNGGQNMGQNMNSRIVENQNITIISGKSHDEPFSEESSQLLVKGEKEPYRGFGIEKTQIRFPERDFLKNIDGNNSRENLDEILVDSGNDEEEYPFEDEENSNQDVSLGGLEKADSESIQRNGSGHRQGHKLSENGTEMNMNRESASETLEVDDDREIKSQSKESVKDDRKEEERLMNAIGEEVQKMVPESMNNDQLNEEEGESEGWNDLLGGNEEKETDRNNTADMIQEKEELELKPIESDLEKNEPLQELPKITDETHQNNGRRDPRIKTNIEMLNRNRGPNSITDREHINPLPTEEIPRVPTNSTPPVRSQSNPNEISKANQEGKKPENVFGTKPLNLKTEKPIQVNSKPENQGNNEDNSNKKLRSKSIAKSNASNDAILEEHLNQSSDILLAQNTNEGTKPAPNGEKIEDNIKRTPEASINPTPSESQEKPPQSLNTSQQISNPSRSLIMNKKQEPTTEKLLKSLKLNRPKVPKFVSIEPVIMERKMILEQFAWPPQPTKLNSLTNKSTLQRENSNSRPISKTNTTEGSKNNNLPPINNKSKKVSEMKILDSQSQRKEDSIMTGKDTKIPSIVKKSDEIKQKDDEPVKTLPKILRESDMYIPKTESLIETKEYIIIEREKHRNQTDRESSGIKEIEKTDGAINTNQNQSDQTLSNFVDITTGSDIQNKDQVRSQPLQKDSNNSIASNPISQKSAGLPSIKKNFLATQKTLEKINESEQEASEQLNSKKTLLDENPRKKSETNANKEMNNNGSSFLIQPNEVESNNNDTQKAIHNDTSVQDSTEKVGEVTKITPNQIISGAKSNKSTQKDLETIDKSPIIKNYHSNPNMTQKEDQLENEIAEVPQNQVQEKDNRNLSTKMDNTMSMSEDRNIKEQKSNVKNYKILEYPSNRMFSDVNEEEEEDISPRRRELENPGSLVLINPQNGDRIDMGYGSIEEEDSQSYLHDDINKELNTDPKNMDLLPTAILDDIKQQNPDWESRSLNLSRDLNRGRDKLEPINPEKMTRTERNKYTYYRDQSQAPRMTNRVVIRDPKQFKSFDSQNYPRGLQNERQDNIFDKNSQTRDISAINELNERIQNSKKKPFAFKKVKYPFLAQKIANMMVEEERIKRQAKLQVMRVRAEPNSRTSNSSSANLGQYPNEGLNTGHIRLTKEESSKKFPGHSTNKKKESEKDLHLRYETKNETEQKKNERNTKFQRITDASNKAYYANQLYQNFHIPYEDQRPGVKEKHDSIEKSLKVKNQSSSNSNVKIYINVA